MCSCACHADGGADCDCLSVALADDYKLTHAFTDTDSYAVTDCRCDGVTICFAHASTDERLPVDQPTTAGEPSH
jgi:hypothetical protein